MNRLIVSSIEASVRLPFTQRLDIQTVFCEMIKIKDSNAHSDVGTTLNTRIADVGGSDMRESCVTSESQCGLVVAVYHNRLVLGVVPGSAIY